MEAQGLLGTSAEGIIEIEEHLRDSNILLKALYLLTFVLGFRFGYFVEEGAMHQ